MNSDNFVFFSILIYLYILVSLKFNKTFLYCYFQMSDISTNELGRHGGWMSNYDKLKLRKMYGCTSTGPNPTGPSPAGNILLQ